MPTGRPRAATKDGNSACQWHCRGRVTGQYRFLGVRERDWRRAGPRRVGRDLATGHIVRADSEALQPSCSDPDQA